MPDPTATSRRAPASTLGSATDSMICQECHQRVAPANAFHPHLYCLLYKAGVEDQATYLRWALEGGSVLKALDLIPFPFVAAPPS